MYSICIPFIRYTLYIYIYIYIFGDIFKDIFGDGLGMYLGRYLGIYLGIYLIMSSNLYMLRSESVLTLRESVWKLGNGF